VGDCKLHVTSVALSRKHKEWKLVNNPFPATLRSGHVWASSFDTGERCPRSCQLAITSDDAATPVRTVDLLVLRHLERMGCKRCCDNCKKGCCEKRHVSGDHQALGSFGWRLRLFVNHHQDGIARKGGSEHSAYRLTKRRHGH
jgi:hypothetical protein